MTPDSKHAGETRSPGGRRDELASSHTTPPHEGERLQRHTRRAAPPSLTIVAALAIVHVQCRDVGGLGGLSLDGDEEPSPSKVAVVFLSFSRIMETLLLSSTAAVSVS